MGINQSHLGQSHGHRIDGEIAPRQIAFQGVAILDLRLARTDLIRIRAIGRDFNDQLSAATTNGPELAANIPGCIPPLRQ